jgi:hypothetical protein
MRSVDDRKLTYIQRYLETIMKKSPLKRRTPLKSKKRLAPRKRIKISKGSGESQVDMFRAIWEGRPHKCFVTGWDIDSFSSSDRFINCFAHILNKNYYKKAKFDPENIVLVHPDVHYLIDHGTKAQRTAFEEASSVSFGEFYSLQSKMKEQYERDSKLPGQ